MGKPQINPKRVGGVARRDTATAILLAARRVLARIGYARLTMRAVARETGMSVGNLAYHFPSKRVLVHSLIEAAVEDYQAKSNEFLRNVDHKHKDGFSKLINWLITDSVSLETSRLFRELWAIALHDRVIAQAMDRFYAQAHDTIARLLVKSNSGLDRSRARDIGQLLGAISEGANVLYATAEGSSASLRRFSQLAVNLLTHAAGAPQSIKRR
jgi:AcrR family transcriptional regulator